MNATLYVPTGFRTTKKTGNLAVDVRERCRIDDFLTVVREVNDRSRVINDPVKF